MPHHEGLLMSRQVGVYFLIDPWEMHQCLNGVISKRIIQKSSLVPRYGIALRWIPTRINDMESCSGDGLVPSGNKLSPKTSLVTQIYVTTWSHHVNMR